MKCRKFEIGKFCNQKEARAKLSVIENFGVYGGQIISQTNILSSCPRNKDYFIAIPSQSYTKETIKKLTDWALKNKLKISEMYC